MSDDSPSKLGAERTKGADRQPPKRTFKERIFHNFREFVAMFLYLWLLFALFTYHEMIVLAKHHIDYKPFGLAFVNAFILAKVMLVAEEIVIGSWKGKTVAESIPKIGGGSPLGLVIASLIFTVAFIPFFAFRELSRVLGKGVLEALLLKRHANDRAKEDHSRAL